MPKTFEIGSPAWDGPDTVRVPVHVPAGCVYFEGHFEGRPMLPGVAQVVALAHAQATRLFGPLGPPTRMARVKFQAVVGPGDDLSLELGREVGAETKIRFSLEKRGGTPEQASSGVLVYR